MKKIVTGIALFLLICLIGCSSATTQIDTTTNTFTTTELTTAQTTTELSTTETTTEVVLRAMIIIGNEFGNTYFNMLESLEELGFSVTTVGVGSRVLMSSCPNHENVKIEVDMNIQDIDEDNIKDYSVVLIPAGKHFRTIKYSGDVGRVLNLAKDNSIYISSVCSGNIVLASVDGLIEGYKIATSTVTLEAIEDAGGIICYSSVVVDGIFVTGRTGNGSNETAPIQEMCETLLSLINNQDGLNT